MSESSLLVIGSVNRDQFISVSRMPVLGETIKGRIDVESAMLPGGKGANQAVCAKRLGMNTKFAGRTGNDTDGKFLRNLLESENLDLSLSSVVENCATGLALIFAQPNGGNSIVIVGGANDSWTCELSADLIESIRNSAVVLLQREIPHKVNLEISKIACEFGVPVILDAGGEDTPLEKDIFPFLYVLSPNETELGRITGMKTDSDAEVELAAQALRSWGVKNVLVKLGERGSAMFAEDGSVIRQNAIHVPAEKIVDTTGAGDCFTAAFAVSMIRSRTHSAQIKNIFKEAMRFASTAATLCIQEKGAIPSMPRFEAVQNQLFQMK